MPRILYKYLDLTGAKCMIGNSNLQFTNATQLNDPFDCHPSLIDHEKNIDENSPWPKEWLIEKEKLDAENFRKRTWLSSFSKVYDSAPMWAHYCKQHTGVCIGFDIEKLLASMPKWCGQVMMEPYLFDVEYQDLKAVTNIYRPCCPQYTQWVTKDKSWEYEQEVRMIIDNPVPWLAALTPDQAKRSKKGEVMDWEEVRHYTKISGDCFHSIYFGKDINAKEKEKIINYIRKKLNPNTKIYQMTIDDSTPRLKAEDITNIQCTSDIELKKKK